MLLTMMMLMLMFQLRLMTINSKMKNLIVGGEDDWETGNFANLSSNDRSNSRRRTNPFVKSYDGIAPKTKKEKPWSSIQKNRPFGWLMCLNCSSLFDAGTSKRLETPRNAVRKRLRPKLVSDGAQNRRCRLLEKRIKWRILISLGGTDAKLASCQIVTRRLCGFPMSVIRISNCWKSLVC
jgi:hypothetical protein